MIKLHPVIRNILAVIVGAIIGSVVNMGIVMISSSIIPPPEGADVTTMEGLKASLHLFEPRHFIMPFFAHAVGTFIGAYLAALIAVSHKMKFAMLIGILFLTGGIMNILMLPSPLWFTLLDIFAAFLHLAYLAS
ncbi:MAG: hypothetical protein ACOYO1_00325 [Bacteroidales bacterium]